MKVPCDTIIGSVLVAWMVIRAKGGSRGPYWLWRRETAFGTKGQVTTRTMLEASRAYSRWVALMHRL